MSISDNDALSVAHGPRTLKRRRNEILIFSVTLLLMLWPLAVNGAPFYSVDSGSYLRGGAFGFSTGLLIIGHWWQSLFEAAGTATASDPKSIVASAIAESRGARSKVMTISFG